MLTTLAIVLRRVWETGPALAWAFVVIDGMAGIGLNANKCVMVSLWPRGRRTASPEERNLTENYRAGRQRESIGLPCFCIGPYRFFALVCIIVHLLSHGFALVCITSCISLHRFSFCVGLHRFTLVSFGLH